MVNLSELLINVVSCDRLKDADKPEPKWYVGMDILVAPWGYVATIPTGKEAEPNPSNVVRTKQGKPDYFPMGTNTARWTDE